MPKNRYTIHNNLQIQPNKIFNISDNKLHISLNRQIENIYKQNRYCQNHIPNQNIWALSFIPNIPFFQLAPNINLPKDNLAKAVIYEKTNAQTSGANVFDG